MSPSKLIKGKKYNYCAAYGKPIEVVKLLDISVQDTYYKGVFCVLTDPCKANRIGVIERFNHIEIERYIQEIN